MAQLDRLSRRGRGAAPVTQAQQVGGAIAPTIAADTVINSVQANIFVADPQFNLIHMNPKAAETLQKLANDIERAFRVRLADVLGGSIHRFHKDPARIEKILQNPQFRPHDAQFSFGAVTLDTHINRILGPDGVVTGYVVAWEDISDKLAAEERAQSLTGRLSETVDKTKDVSVALQSVSAAMEEMSATVLEIARNGSDTAGVVTAAVTVVEAATTTMNDLGQASTQINEVVNTISQIAKQTNLLALNATIEAARAGESGKGFGVVAGEVKDLSAATQTATERIGGLIENVQGLSRAAAAAMTSIAEIVDKVRDGQAATAAAVEQQTATNHEISRSLSQAAQQAELVTADLTEFLDATN